MSNALLDKARAILAHPKQGPYPKAEPMEAGENKFPITEATVPAVIPGGIAPPHAAPSKNVEIQPAAPNAKAIYWQTGDGRILGPAVPEFFLRDGEEYWISMTFKGNVRFIRDDRLRSRKAFEEQVEVRQVELIRTF